MNIWLALIIILIVLGVIIGNILLLKQSAKQPLPKVSNDNNAHYDEKDDKW
ncbi:DUF2897 family protein [Paraglaciecola sp.]|uniref:DUF2897 family protein n=1 Tax=Pseudomonadati TaxID=3379134 RepID=UPI00273EA974|nr:DUF2897 family protein [Paraglaciecola sp.]MDP5031232.1 DUF2897 family protein [Paraglaciecola sp.]